MSPAAPPELERALQPLRVVVAALAGGVLCFGAVAVWLVSRGGALSGGDPGSLGIALLALVVLELAALPILRRRLAPPASAPGGDRGVQALDVLPRFSTWTILRAALVEGPTMFALVIYLLSGAAWALLAVAAGLALLVGLLPTAAKLRAFAEGR